MSSGSRNLHHPFSAAPSPKLLAVFQRTEKGVGMRSSQRVGWGGSMTPMERQLRATHQKAEREGGEGNVNEGTQSSRNDADCDSGSRARLCVCMAYASRCTNRVRRREASRAHKKHRVEKVRETTTTSRDATRVTTPKGRPTAAPRKVCKRRGERTAREARREVRHAPHIQRIYIRHTTHYIDHVSPEKGKGEGERCVRSGVCVCVCMRA